VNPAIGSAGYHLSPHAAPSQFSVFATCLAVRGDMAIHGPVGDVEHRIGGRKKLRLVSGEDIARTKLELPLADTDSLSRNTLARLRNDWIAT